MKKYLTTILMSTISVCALAYDFEEGGIYYEITSSNEQTIAVTYHNDYNNGDYTGDITIPENVEHAGKTYRVTSIHWGAFCGSTELKTVSIPNSVETIGENAFARCTGLKSILIGSGVKNIGSGAFASCSSLEKVEYVSLKSLCNIKFTHENSNPLYSGGHLYIAGEIAKSIVIPDDITHIMDYAFWQCKDIEQITLPYGLIDIGKYAFFGCENLQSLKLPDNVLSIGICAFRNCSSLTSVQVGKGMQEIGGGAFQDCKNIGIVDYASMESLCSIKYQDTDSNPLLWSHHLTINGKTINDIVIPNTVTSIGDYAFLGWGDDFTSISIPESITKIGKSAFLFRSANIKKVEFASIRSLCGIEFANSIANPITYTFKLVINGEEVRDVNIPAGVTSIGDYAFHGADNISSVVIPASVTSIGKDAFWGNYGLGNIYCLGSNPPSIANNSFTSYHYSGTYLHVPSGSKSKYESTSYWNQFENIIDGLPSAVESIEAEDGNRVSRIYDLSGRRLNGKQRGLNILIDGSGKARKVTNR